ncbi:hypothetical protein BHE74_00051949 [Ensete ventricosum]|nr:hypothetical protein BHE74_00051949 [Ensete ventricosum]
MTGAMKLQPDDGPKSSLSIGSGFRRCSGISPEFARRFVERIGELVENMLGACWKINRSSPKVSGLVGSRWKLAKGIGGMSGVRRELAKGDRELARNALGVRQKMTKTRREFAGGYREDHRELGWSLDMLVKLIVFVCLSMSQLASVWFRL